MADEEGYTDEPLGEKGSFYHTDSFLEYIEKYDIEKQSIRHLIEEIIQPNWKFGGVGYFEVKNKRKTTWSLGPEVEVKMSTAGWSGNEEIYAAFVKIKNIDFYWEKSQRGGHYTYIFPKEIYYR